MRWFQAQYNDRRIIKRFPIIPCLISWTKEVRWLEMVYIEQFYTSLSWVDDAFVTKEKYIKYKGERFK